MAELSFIEDRPENRTDRVWPSLLRFSRRLAGLLARLPSSGPLLVHGPFGSGKSTALTAALSLVSDRPDARPVVWFDASRRTSIADLLTSFLRTIWQGAHSEWRRGETGLHAQAALWRGALTLANASPFPAEVQPDAVERMREAFARTVNEGWTGRPVVVIDELCSCPPAIQLALLKLLHQLSSGPASAAAFAVGADRATLLSAIGGADAERRLSRFFPISVNLPTPSLDDIAYLAHQLRTRLGPTLLTEPLKDSLIQTFARPVFSNPRLLKTAATRLGLALTLEAEEGEAPKAPEVDGILVEWLAATLRWPALKTLAQRLTTAEWDDVRKAMQGGASSSELIQEFGDRQAILWCQAQVFRPRSDRLSAFLEADRRLNRLGL